MSNPAYNLLDTVKLVRETSTGEYAKLFDALVKEMHRLYEVEKFAILLAQDTLRDGPIADVPSAKCVLALTKEVLDING